MQPILTPEAMGEPVLPGAAVAQPGDPDAPSAKRRSGRTVSAEPLAGTVTVRDIGW